MIDEKELERARELFDDVQIKSDSVQIKINDVCNDETLITISDIVFTIEPVEGTDEDSEFIRQFPASKMKDLFVISELVSGDICKWSLKTNGRTEGAVTCMDGIVMIDHYIIKHFKYCPYCGKPIKLSK